MGFWIHKTPSVTMKVDVCIEPEIVYVNYKNYDCFVYKNKMKDFIFNKGEIETCKREYKFFINFVDILFYFIMLVGIGAGLFWEKQIGLSLFSKEVFLGIFVIFSLFTFLKFTQVFVVKLKSGEVYYIPVAGFIFCLSKEKRNKINRLEKILLNFRMP